jgi:hypothetical protein
MGLFKDSTAIGDCAVLEAGAVNSIEVLLVTSYPGPVMVKVGTRRGEVSSAQDVSVDVTVALDASEVEDIILVELALGKAKVSEVETGAL